MQNAIRKGRVLLPGLAAAAFAGWMGAPAAHGDFNIVAIAGQTSGGKTSYELEAENFGANNAANTGLSPSANNTGSTLLGWDLIVTMNNHAQGFVFETNVDIDGDGEGGADANSNSINYSDANVVGQATDAATYSQYAGSQPSFGKVTGTFEGLPNGANHQSTITYSEVEALYINGDTTAHVNQPIWHSYNKTSATSTAINSAFTTANGVWALEVDFAPTSGGVADGTSLRPFANFVVPTGAQFTISGQIGGETGNPFSFTPTVINGSPITTGGSTVSLSLTNTAPSQGSLIANVTMTGSDTLGYPIQTFAVSGAAATAGYLSVSGWTAATSKEIFGLDANGATSLSQLITDLQAAVNAGATVEAPTGSAGALLAAEGDNIEVVFPTGPNPSGLPSVFSYNFGAYTTNGSVTISNVSVIPEPTSLGLLAASGLGLLSRRRRRLRKKKNKKDRKNNK